MNNLSKQDIYLLRETFPHLIFKDNFPLKNLTYFKIGGPAELFVEVSDKQELIKLLKHCKTAAIKVTMLGGASNVVVSDEGVKGLVIRHTNDEFKVLDSTAENWLIYAAAGLKTSLLVRKTMDLNLGGLEYFLGVPGTLGGAIYNNAHYLQHLIGEYIEEVEIIDQDCEIIWISKEAAAFAYDSSRFHQTKEFILGAKFLLPKTDPERSKELLIKATKYRAETQPLGLPSSGCIFRNVQNNDSLRKIFPQFAQAGFVPGGFLIDQAGLKGEHIGDIEVSHKHAAFFVNHGNGTAEQIKELIKIVKQRVEEKFGVQLQEEVFWLE